MALQGSTSVGRKPTRKAAFTNTVVPDSAAQAMLLKLDEIIDLLTALRTASATDAAALATAFAASAAIEKVKLVP